MDWLGNVHTRDESGISLGKTVNSASGSVVDMNEEASPTHKESEWC